MPPTSDQLWDAIYRIYTEDGAPDKIQSTVIAKLIELGMVELSTIGLPWLTVYGEQCYKEFEAGENDVLEHYDMAVAEFEQWVRDELQAG